MTARPVGWVAFVAWWRGALSWVTFLAGLTGALTEGTEYDGGRATVPRRTGAVVRKGTRAERAARGAVGTIFFLQRCCLFPIGL